jgi:ABC-type Fe3+-hydroxamate transport system substrate-binding protein
MLTLDDVRAALTRLDELTGGPSDRGRELRAAFDAALSPNPETAAALGHVLCLAWTDPPGVMGPGSFHAQLIHALGATAVPAEGTPYIEWSVEDVVRTDPDSLVLLRPDSEDDLETALGPLARMNLRCVREGRVIIVRDPLCHTPSTALAGVAEFIAAEVRRWPPRAP